MILTIEMPEELAEQLAVLPEDERSRFAAALMQAGAAHLANPDGGGADEVTWLESLLPAEQDTLLTNLIASLPPDVAADSNQGRPARFLSERAARLRFMAAMGSKFKRRFRPYRAAAFGGAGAGSAGAIGDDVQGYVDRLRDAWDAGEEHESRVPA